MARKPASKSQVSGEKFQNRQYTQAVITGNPTAVSEVSTASGKVGMGVAAGAALIGLSVLLSFMSPSPDHGDADLIRTKSGGLFVAVAPEGDENGTKVLHEVRNLASARLITGSADDPTTVGNDVIGTYARGPLMGIEGAPNSLAAHSADEGSYWGVCDWRDTRATLSLTESANLQTTVVSGNIWSGGDVLDKSTGILVRPSDNQNELHLIFGNRVAKIDESDYAMIDALGITRGDIDKAAVVSRGLLNSITRSPALKAPTLGSNGQPSGEVSNSRVGDVLSSPNGNLYAVLDDGVQRISPLVADVLTAHGGSKVEVSDEEAASHPQRGVIDLDTFPNAAPSIIDPATTCMAWSRGAGSTKPSTRILYGDTLPVSNTAADQAVRTIEPSDGSSEVADRFITRPGTGWFTRVTGNGDAADEESQVSYISDSGVRYDVKPQEGEYAPVLEALGLGGDPTLIPDGVARLIPKGPDLDREAAMVESVGKPVESEAPGAGGGSGAGVREQVPEETAPETSEPAPESAPESEPATESSEVPAQETSEPEPDSSEEPAPDLGNDPALRAAGEPRSQFTLARREDA